MRSHNSRGILLATVAVIVQAILAQLTASLVFNLIALIVLAPWTLLLLIHPHPSAAAGWAVTGVIVVGSVGG
jgi:hypothetical protein